MKKDREKEKRMRKKIENEKRMASERFHISYALLIN